MYKAQWLTLVSSSLLLASSALAVEHTLGSSRELGLNDVESAKKLPKGRGNPEEKISDLGNGAYVRQYKDFGQPMVEVHPENGPSYYYNENEIQQSNPDDGVHFHETPQWMLGQW